MKKKTVAKLPITKIKILVKKALKEDEAFNDITTRALFKPGLQGKFKIVFKEKGVLCGIDFARETFLNIDKKIVFKKLKNDGELIKKRAAVAEIYGRVGAILSAERTALNFLGHLSGIATLTREFVKITTASKIQITDTRKTHPFLRKVEKYAVRVGGGISHRMDLADYFLIKDNHLDVLVKKEKIKSAIEFAIRKIKNKNKGLKKIEIEIKNLREFKDALNLTPDIIMLDNMNIKSIKKALLRRKKLNPRVKIEVSGGVSLSNIKKLSSLDIDYISIGMLTHSPKLIDVSLEVS